MKRQLEKVMTPSIFCCIYLNVLNCYRHRKAFLRLDLPVSFQNTLNDPDFTHYSFTHVITCLKVRRILCSLIWSRYKSKGWIKDVCFAKNISMIFIKSSVEYMTGQRLCTFKCHYWSEERLIKPLLGNHFGDYCPTWVLRITALHQRNTSKN